MICMNEDCRGNRPCIDCHTEMMAPIGSAVFALLAMATDNQVTAAHKPLIDHFFAVYRQKRVEIHSAQDADFERMQEELVANGEAMPEPEQAEEPAEQRMTEEEIIAAVRAQTGQTAPEKDEKTESEPAKADAATEAKPDASLNGHAKKADKADKGKRPEQVA